MSSLAAAASSQLFGLLSLFWASGRLLGLFEICGPLAGLFLALGASPGPLPLAGCRASSGPFVGFFPTFSGGFWILWARASWGLWGPLRASGGLWGPLGAPLGTFLGAPLGRLWGAPPLGAPPGASGQRFPETPHKRPPQRGPQRPLQNLPSRGPPPEGPPEAPPRGPPQNPPRNPQLRLFWPFKASGLFPASLGPLRASSGLLGLFLSFGAFLGLFRASGSCGLF